MGGGWVTGPMVQFFQREVYDPMGRPIDCRTKTGPMRHLIKLLSTREKSYGRFYGTCHGLSNGFYLPWKPAGSPTGSFMRYATMGHRIHMGSRTAFSQNNISAVPYNTKDYTPISKRILMFY